MQTKELLSRYPMKAEYLMRTIDRWRVLTDANSRVVGQISDKG
jgi:hypothetical protein